jgi:hypothetical protein
MKQYDTLLYHQGSTLRNPVGDKEYLRELYRYRKERSYSWLFNTTIRYESDFLQRDGPESVNRTQAAMLDNDYNLRLRHDPPTRRGECMRLRNGLTGCVLQKMLRGHCIRL